MYYSLELTPVNKGALEFFHTKISKVLWLSFFFSVSSPPLCSWRLFLHRFLFLVDILDVSGNYSMDIYFSDKFHFYNRNT